MTIAPDVEIEPTAEPPRLEALLDEALAESFPASDPVALVRREEEAS